MDLNATRASRIQQYGKRYQPHDDELQLNVAEKCVYVLSEEVETNNDEKNKNAR